MKISHHFFAMKYTRTEVRELYDSGLSYKKIADQIGCSASTVQSILKSTPGFIPRASGGKCTFNPEQAIEMWNDGNTLDQIARHFKVNRTAIREQLKKHNIDTSKDAIDITELSKLVKEGKTDTQISSILGKSVHYVARKRRETLGVSDKVERLRSNIDELVDFLHSSPTFRDTLDKFSPMLDRSTITKYYDMFGLDRPKDSDNFEILEINKDAIIERLQAGDSKLSIKNEFGIKSEKTLDQFIVDNCPDYKWRGYYIPTEIYKKLTDYDWCLDAANRYSKNREGYRGLTRELNDTYNANIGTDIVADYLNELGIEVNVVPLTDTIPLLNDADWLRLQYQTHSLVDIADQLGCSHPTVKRAFERHGIEISIEPHTSKVECQIAEFVKSLYPDALTNDREIVGPKELDIVVPECNIAIEVCGLYWHSDKFKPNNYHKQKMELANTAGYRLITIFEDEWEYKREIVKTKLANILGKSVAPRVYARQCEIQTLTNAEASEFMDLYHIQGRAKDSIRYALTFNEQVVAVMTFSYSRYQSGHVELNRFASSCNVVGGFSKLLKHAITNHPDWKCIDTFADLRWSDRYNNVYKKNGFNEVHVTAPAYFYYINDQRKHRMNFTKDKLSQLLGDKYDDSLTERANAQNNGLRAIYDCGNIKYTLDLENYP